MVTLSYQGPLWAAPVVVVAVAGLVVWLRQRRDQEDRDGTGSGGG
ncbi:MAG TPA: hypothetical protein VHF25_14655 [Nitriliruptorales bacterium]|nr:hypothetical protein [Nitriliruptorales bacterium]